MRNKLTLVILVVIVAIGLAVILVTKRSSTQPGAILLGRVPDHYCPQQAQVVVTPANSTVIELDKSIDVIDCRSIDLTTLLKDLKSPNNLFIKLPEALASKLLLGSATSSYSFVPILGDVNGDNIIDGVDQSLVEKALLSKDGNLNGVDVDQDKAVTVLDLSLTRINAQVGVDRPDKKRWEK